MFVLLLIAKLVLTFGLDLSVAFETLDHKIMKCIFEKFMKLYSTLCI